MKNQGMRVVLALFSFFFLAVNTASAGESISAKVEPGTVELGTFYNGTTVKVQGQIPAAADVIIRLSGEGEELHLKRKGKVGGLLWMNTGDLTFENAPRVFKLVTPKGMEDLSGTPVQSYGFDALKEQVEVAPESSDKDFLIGEFVRLKEKAEMYSITPGGISYGPAGNNVKQYTGLLDIPSGMTQGIYKVEVIAFQGGSILGKAEESVVLKQVGFPEQLSRMAFQHEIWYGVMSVVIALMAGLIMGVVFKGKGGAH